MQDNFGMKEMYDVCLRTNQKIEIDGRVYFPNESILSFSRVNLATVDEQRHIIQATGGYHNNALVNWETDKAVNFSLSDGILSPISWALLSNSKMNEKQRRSVNYMETVRCLINDDYCCADLKYCPNNMNEIIGAQGNPKFEPMPMGRKPELMLKPLPPSKTKWIYCYDIATGRRIEDFSLYGNRLYFKEEFDKVNVDYTFDFNERIRTLSVGERLFNGFMSLTGKMSSKGYANGDVKTVVLEIPKIKLSSTINLELGTSYNNSIVNKFYFTGYPDENLRREKQSTFYLHFLDGELTGEYE